MKPEPSDKRKKKEPTKEQVEAKQRKKNFMRSDSIYRERADSHMRGILRWG